MSMPPVVSGSRPLIGHVAEFMSTPEELLWRGQREHGEMFTVRLPGQKAVFILGSERHRFFFAESDKKLSAAAAYPFFVKMFDPEFYVFAGPEEYRRQRELIVPRFQGRQLEGYVAAMEAETDAFLRSLGASGEFDLIEALGPLVMRIAARCFLGPDFASRMNLDFFEEFRRFSGGMGFAPPWWVPTPAHVRSWRSRDRLRAALGNMIRERRENPLDPPDFLQTLAGATYSDGTPAPDNVLVNFVLLLTWAGHETTAGQMAWGLIDLLQHPEHLAQVVEESEKAVAAGVMDLEATKVLSHLDNCLHETERLHPVAYVQARKAAQDFEMDGYTVPKGTFVFISPAVSHRLASEFPNPDEFQPKRYEGNRQQRQALVGFGGGVHRCTGVHFAYLEMKVVLARLLTSLHLELIDEPKPVPGAKTKWPASPCRVKYQVIPGWESPFQAG